MDTGSGMQKEILELLVEGNERYRRNSDENRRLDTAENGQHPYAIVVCCSDSRVIPEQIFDAGLGDSLVSDEFASGFARLVRANLDRMV